jgi:hypothetical protein
VAAIVQQLTSAMAGNDASGLPGAFLEDALRAPPTAIRYAMSRALAERNPGRAVVVVEGAEFDLEAFADAGLAAMTSHERVHAQRSAEPSGPNRELRAARSSFAARVEWEGRRHDVVRLAWREGFVKNACHFVVADDVESADRFVRAVAAHSSAPRGFVPVFANGARRESYELHAAMERASFDELILPPGVLESIRSDVDQFLAGSEAFARYGVPFKRGVLMIGPPGNGKTHCLRALMRHAGWPVLVVQGFKSRSGDEEEGIHCVFARARRVAPCLLVMEDLDALVTPASLSAFLNQVDGLASDTGILTLATTNHPERVDPALIDRPSRFDRKYHFPLPGLGERERYVDRWNEKLDEAMRLPAEFARAVVNRTEGFSFAYLKELFVSSMLAWMVDRAPGSMPAIVERQLVALRGDQRSVTIDLAPVRRAARSA